MDLQAFPVGRVDDTPREAVERTRWTIEADAPDEVVARSPSGWTYRVVMTTSGPIAQPIRWQDSWQGRGKTRQRPTVAGGAA